MTTTSAHGLSLRSILEKEKLNGTNFLDWERNLRIVLKHEKKEHVIDQPLPPRPDAGSTRSVRDAHEKHLNDSLEVGCVMLSTMEPGLQKQMIKMSGDSFSILEQLREMFQEQARTERFRSVKSMMFTKMSSGESVSRHVLKMKGKFEHL